MASEDFQPGLLGKFFNLHVLATPEAGEVWAISESFKEILGFLYLTLHSLKRRRRGVGRATRGRLTS